MGWLNREREVKAIDKPIEERSIIEIMETVPHCNPMNSDSIKKDLESLGPFNFRRKNAFEGGYWLNPNEQTAFNYGTFNHQDFIDWANGTGTIVKGKNQEEKDKMMYYAKFHMEHNLSVSIYSKHLHLIDADYKVKISYYMDGGSSPRNYIKTHKREDSEIVKDMLSSCVQVALTEIKDQIQYSMWREGQTKDNAIQDASQKINDYMYPVTHTLMKMGVGYLHACNTPQILENLAWSKDLVFAKAYSLYLEEEGIELPDYEWCESYIGK